jgi:purine-binding chemotaxis protein CheW
MSEAATSVRARAAELRLDFDRAFAEPIRLDTTPKEDLLAIRVGGRACAIRLSEIAGLFAGKSITRVPGGNGLLCGIAGFRGSILPVYDLQALLGRCAAQMHRWLVVTAAQPAALAFEAFDGQLRVPRDAILPQPARPGAPSYAREFLRTQDFSGPIMHVPSILDAIGASKFEAAAKEEQ